MMSSSDCVHSEDGVVSLAACLLRQEGYKIRCEVPNMGQSADIVATRGRWVTFVEAKLTKWRRALEQCVAHEQVADYVCVALATARVAHELIELGRARGYGIIHCNLRQNTSEWIVRPRRNPNVWRPQRRRWAKSLRTIDYAHD